MTLKGTLLLDIFAAIERMNKEGRFKTVYKIFYGTPNVLYGYPDVDSAYSEKAKITAIPFSTEDLKDACKFISEVLSSEKILTCHMQKSPGFRLRIPGDMIGVRDAVAASKLWAAARNKVLDAYEKEKAIQPRKIYSTMQTGCCAMEPQPICPPARNTAQLMAVTSPAAALLSKRFCPDLEPSTVNKGEKKVKDFSLTNLKDALVDKVTSLDKKTITILAVIALLLLIVGKYQDIKDIAKGIKDKVTRSKNFKAMVADANSAVAGLKKIVGIKEKGTKDEV